MLVVHDLVKGALIGLAVAAPVGPIGMLVITRSLHDGFRVGLATGLGAALADGIFALAGALVTSSVTPYLGHAWLLELVGGAALCLLAARALGSRTAPARTSSPGAASYARALVTTALLTLANPTTVLSFAAIAASVGLADAAPAVARSVVFALSVALGSALWWVVLSGGIARLGHRLSPTQARVVRLASSGVLFAFGSIAIAKAVASSMG